ncbi:MAG: 23S rRNA (adenine(2503)-C(2))-methyltransferase RlmN [Candidatus Omnitrophica bacterium]|nr:23S rRNA (adenine(2503)-C(2))-methyltransferase RlmN [Candidatus Omnitrophota bacterium]
MKADIKDYTLSELEKCFIGHSLPKFLARQVFDWVYKKRVEDFLKMSNISNDNRLFLKDNFYFSWLECIKREVSRDKTEKFLFKLRDNTHIETVLIPEPLRRTLCVSSQVGCKFSCKFCASGQFGFKRNLGVSEIINQYLFIADALFPETITNIVFMGVGEPLDNFTNVIKAIGILTEPAGPQVSSRRITISTCGLAPEIIELGKLSLGIKLSVSLHASTDAKRSNLMPVNKTYPLSELMKAVRYFAKHERYPVTFEYVLIRGFNTSKEDALQLSRLLSGLRYKINLIPYNLSSLDFNSPDNEEISLFTGELQKRGVFFTLRKPRGQDITAACGQLRASWSRTR